MNTSSINTNPLAAALAVALMLTLIILITGCASVPPPLEELAVAESAVQRADTINTRESAPVELQIAIDKLANAREAAAREDFERAKQLADQATLDAQVAMLRAETVRAQSAAQESQDAARMLRKEINRMKTNQERIR